MSMFARTASGDWEVPLRIVTDVPTIARQKVSDTLNLWQGEWFISLLDGFPWLQKVLSLKNPNVTQIRGLLRTAILAVPNVESVTEVGVRLDPETGAFAYSASGTLKSGGAFAVSS